MASSPRSIEVKVGMLILAALGLLALAIVIMGGISFEPKYEVRVGFDNPGGLAGGAPVRIAGVKVGSISDIEFLGGGTDPTTGKERPVVLARVKLEKRYQASVRDTSSFYITTSGLLGEQFLAIDPGPPGGTPLPDGGYVRGMDPPRLDQALAEGYDLLTTLVDLLREHKPAVADIVEGLAKTLRGTGAIMEHNQERVDRIAANLELLSLDAVETLRGARRQYVDNPRLDRLITNADQLGADLARDVPPLVKDGRTAINDVKRVVDAVGSEEQVARIKSAVDDVATIAADAKVAVKDARGIVSHVRQGRGSVGALLMDEQLFDDLQEMARDLKHNPWKFFWKE